MSVESFLYTPLKTCPEKILDILNSEQFYKIKSKFQFKINFTRLKQYYKIFEVNKVYIIHITNIKVKW